MHRPAVHLRSVLSLVDRFPVLAGVNLDVGEGEIVMLEGSNGAGKTSLLRVLAGLLPVTEGVAEVLGHDLVTDRSSAGVRRAVGLLGHEPFLYDDLTVKENIEFFVRMAGADAGRVEAVMTELGLNGRLSNTVAGRISQGQRRRVALAVLLVRDPALWLLDEPHAGLDAATREALDRAIVRAASRGRTVIFSSHETERSSGLAHRVVCIEGGQVVVELDELRVAVPGGDHVA